MKEKVVVGLTASFGDEYQSTWSSGIFQNIYFLYRLFEMAPRVEAVYFVDQTQVDEPIKQTTLGNYTCNVISAAEAVQKVDVLIEVGQQLWKHIADGVTEKGGKIVSLRLGSSYIDEVMATFHDRPPFLSHNGVQYDEFWGMPHHEKTSSAMLSVLSRCHNEIMPYVWEPFFVQAMIDRDPESNRFSYVKGKASRNAAICEPNMSPVKMFHIPLLACEALYRQNPELLNHVFVMNGFKLKESPSFLQFVNRLDVFKTNVASFEGRLDIVTLMTHHADIIVAHHWDNGLNYLYLDAMYGGFPVVHNSEFIKDFGYYYEGFDAYDGAAQIKRAILEHDDHLEAYREKNKELFYRYSIFNPDNIKAYDERVWALYNNQLEHAS